MIKAILVIVLILGVMTISYWSHSESKIFKVLVSHQYEQRYWIFLVFAEEAKTLLQYKGNVVRVAENYLALKPLGGRNPNIAIDSLHPKSILD